MTQQFKTGDTVKVLRHGSAGKHMQGVTTRVVEGNKDGGDFVYVEDPTGCGLFTKYGDTTSWIIDNDNLELVEEALADWEKELLGIETKQEPEVKQTIKVGDKVRVLEKSIWHSKGETGEVEEVHDDGSVQVNNWWISPKNVELVTEKPKTRSQEISREEIQKDDLIVVFFEYEGTEIRIKGIADHADHDGDWLTKTGGYLTYEDNIDIKGIYLLERPEVKEPEIADGTYWVTEKDVNDFCWWKVEVKDSKTTWGIRGDMSDKAYADYDYLVEASKGNWHVVHTSNPFTEPTDLEKFEQAGNVGQKYKHCGMIYKLSKKGKVKVRSAGKGASWFDSAHTVGSFLELVEFGDAVKIS